MTEGDHDVHLVMPHLARVLPGHHRPELEHVDDELEAVAEDEHADDDQKDRPHHDLSLLTFGQSVQPFVPSSEMVNSFSVFCSTTYIYYYELMVEKVYIFLLHFLLLLLFMDISVS